MANDIIWSADKESILGFGITDVSRSGSARLQSFGAFTSLALSNVAVDAAVLSVVACSCLSRHERRSSRHERRRGWSGAAGDWFPVASVGAGAEIVIPEETRWTSTFVHRATARANEELVGVYGTSGINDVVGAARQKRLADALALRIHHHAHLTNCVFPVNLLPLDGAVGLLFGIDAFAQGLAEVSSIDARDNHSGSGVGGTNHERLLLLIVANKVGNRRRLDRGKRSAISGAKALFIRRNASVEDTSAVRNRMRHASLLLGIKVKLGAAHQLLFLEDARVDDFALGDSFHFRLFRNADDTPEVAVRNRRMAEVKVFGLDELVDLNSARSHEIFAILAIGIVGVMISGDGGE